MTDPTRSSTLRRMTRNGRTAPQFGAVSPEKALRLALAKAGQEVLGQIVSAAEVTQAQAPVQELAGLLPENGLNILLSGPGDCQGLVVLERAIVAGVTEALTIGRVMPVPPPDRVPSSTDAHLCQRFLVMMMTVFAAKLVGHPAAQWATGFVPENRLEDLRRLPFLFDDVAYRVLSLDVDLALGAKSGRMAVVLPWEATSSRAAREEADAADAAHDWESSLRQALMPAKAKLEAVLHRMEIPLSEMVALKPDALLRIPRSALSKVELCDCEGHPRMRGGLGQSQGFRAVRVTSLPRAHARPPDEDFTEHDEAAPDPIAALVNAPALGNPALAGQHVDDPGEEAGGDQAAAELPDLPGLHDLDGPDDASDPADEEAPQFDIASLPMDDLDDLPMAID